MKNSQSENDIPQVKIAGKFRSIAAWDVFRCKFCGSYHSLLECHFVNGSPKCPDCKQIQI